MGLSNPFWVSFPLMESFSEVMTSPKVHGDVVSILTWYSFRHTRKRGRHGPEHSELGPAGLPVQHFPASSFPASLSKDRSRNSNTPDDSACGNENTLGVVTWWCHIVIFCIAEDLEAVARCSYHCFASFTARSLGGWSMHDVSYLMQDEVKPD